MKSESKIKKLRLALLKETAAHFNSNNLSINSNKDIGSSCLYSGVGCAIGRLIEDKELCKKLDAFHTSGTTAVCRKEIFELIPESLQELGAEFLRELQYLHDEACNWTPTGLSTCGIKKFDEIKVWHCV